MSSGGACIFRWAQAFGMWLKIDPSEKNVLLVTKTTLASGWRQLAQSAIAMALREGA